MKEHDESVLSRLLREGYGALGLTFSPIQHQQFLDYVALLSKWNGVYNLTSVREAKDMVILHLLDSLAILPTLDRLSVNHLLDVGSGAGLPGIPLAIARPDLKVVLIDTVHKKVAFLNQAKGALGLLNLSAHHSRVEVFSPAQKFDLIVSRAFSEIKLFVELTQHLLEPKGLWMAMKGVVPKQEITDSAAICRIREIVDLNIPGLKAERCLVLLEAEA